MTQKLSDLTISKFLVDAREPYLTFLRNIGPQIFVASLAWVTGAKLDFTKIDFSNTPATAMFYGFLLLFLYAVYANSSIFLKAVLPTFEPWLRAQESYLKGRNTPRLMVPLLLLRSVFRYKKTEIFLVFLVSVLMQFLIAGAFASSIVSALTLIHGMKG